MILSDIPDIETLVVEDLGKTLIIIDDFDMTKLGTHQKRNLSMLFRCISSHHYYYYEYLFCLVNMLRCELNRIEVHLKYRTLRKRTNIANDWWLGSKNALPLKKWRVGYGLRMLKSAASS